MADALNVIRVPFQGPDRLTQDVSLPLHFGGASFREITNLGMIDL